MYSIQYVGISAIVKKDLCSAVIFPWIDSSVEREICTVMA